MSRTRAAARSKRLAAAGVDPRPLNRAAAEQRLNAAAREALVKQARGCASERIELNLRDLKKRANACKLPAERAYIYQIIDALQSVLDAREVES